MNRGSIVGGVILILVGLFFLLLPLFPNVSANLDIEQQWPLIIVAIGGLFLLGALMGAPGLAIPGSIIAGLGLLMYYQNMNDAWETWAFAWALIPGFVGIGIVIARALKGEARRGVREGSGLIIISIVLFFVFGSFLGGGFSFGLVLALFLIGFGLWLVYKTIFSTGRDKSK